MSFVALVSRVLDSVGATSRSKCFDNPYNSCPLYHVLAMNGSESESPSDDFGLDNCDAIVETFILEANAIANASFSEVEAIAISNIELQ
nr:hypothetical protein CFP56_14588 [Quercus suber]